MNGICVKVARGIGLNQLKHRSWLVIAIESCHMGVWRLFL